MKLILLIIILALVNYAAQQNSNVPVTQCPFGFFRNPNNTCIECLSSCSRCQSLEGDCRACSQGFKLAFDQTRCEPCDIGRLFCTPLDMSCQRYFRPQNGICKPKCIVQNCIECSSIIATSCNTCAVGYSLNPSRTACVPPSVMRVSNGNIRTLQQSSTTTTTSSSTQDIGNDERMRRIFDNFNINSPSPTSFQNANSNVGTINFQDIINSINRSLDFNLNSLPNVNTLPFGSGSAGSSSLSGSGNIINGGSSTNSASSFNFQTSSSTSAAGSAGGTGSFSIDNGSGNIGASSGANFGSGAANNNGISNFNNNGQGITSASTSTSTSASTSTTGSTSGASISAGSNLNSGSLNGITTSNTNLNNAATATATGSGVSTTGSNTISSQPITSTPTNINPAAGLLGPFLSQDMTSQYYILNGQRIFLPNTSQPQPQPQPQAAGVNTGVVFSQGGSTSAILDGGSAISSGSGSTSSSSSSSSSTSNINFPQNVPPITPVGPTISPQSTVISNNTSTTRVIQSSLQPLNDTRILNQGITINQTVTTIVQNNSVVTNTSIPAIVNPVPVPLVPVVIPPEVQPLQPIAPVPLPVPVPVPISPTIPQFVPPIKVPCRINQFQDERGLCTVCNTRCLTCINSADQCLACSQGFVKLGWKCIAKDNIPFNITLKVPLSQKAYAYGDGMNLFKRNFISFILPRSYAGSNLQVMTVNSIAYNESTEQMTVNGIVQKRGDGTIYEIGNQINGNLIASSTSTNLWPFGIVYSNSTGAIINNNTANNPVSNSSIPVGPIPGKSQGTGEPNLLVIILPAVLGGLCLLSMLGLLLCFLKKWLCFKNMEWMSSKTIPNIPPHINDPNARNGEPAVTNRPLAVTTTQPIIPYNVPVPQVPIQVVLNAQNQYNKKMAADATKQNMAISTVNNNNQIGANYIGSQSNNLTSIKEVSTQSQYLLQKKKNIPNIKLISPSAGQIKKQISSTNININNINTTNVSSSTMAMAKEAQMQRRLPAYIPNSKQFQQTVLGQGQGQGQQRESVISNNNMIISETRNNFYGGGGVSDGMLISNTPLIQSTVGVPKKITTATKYEKEEEQRMANGIRMTKQVRTIQQTKPIGMTGISNGYIQETPQVYVQQRSQPTIYYQSLKTIEPAIASGSKIITETTPNSRRIIEQPIVIENRLNTNNLYVNTESNSNLISNMNIREGGSRSYLGAVKEYKFKDGKLTQKQIRSAEEIPGLIVTPLSTSNVNYIEAYNPNPNINVISGTDIASRPSQVEIIKEYKKVTETNQFI